MTKFNRSGTRYVHEGEKYTREEFAEYVTYHILSKDHAYSIYGNLHKVLPGDDDKNFDYTYAKVSEGPLTALKEFNAVNEQTATKARVLAKLQSHRIETKQTEMLLTLIQNGLTDAPIFKTIAHAKSLEELKNLAREMNSAIHEAEERVSQINEENQNTILEALGAA